MRFHYQYNTLTNAMTKLFSPSEFYKQFPTSSYSARKLPQCHKMLYKRKQMHHSVIEKAQIL